MRRLSAILAASLMGASAAGLATPASAQMGVSRLFSCEQSGRKQEGGAAVGAVLGALVGSQISKNERALGAVAGAALGAGVGSYVGCRMQSTDQARAQAATKAALDQGRSQTWNNPQTGASGRVDLLAASYGPPVRSDAWRFERGVQQYATYEAIGGPGYAPGVVNLRGGPSTSSPVVGKLQAGEQFDILGGMPGGSWVLIGRYAMAVGYAASNLVRNSAPPQPIACRTIQTTTNVRGYGGQIERFEACRDGRGEWRLTAV